MKQILDYISDNAELFIILLSENGDSSFQREIMFLEQQKIISDIHKDLNINARTSEYLKSFSITGALSIVQKWLQDDMIESTEEMTELISKLLYKGSSAFYS